MVILKFIPLSDAEIGQVSLKIWLILSANLIFWHRKK